MSSGEEFEVEEILEQRKRKGVVEFLVRWRGFNNLYDSWEPASGLADCTRVLKAWAAKTRRSRSKSRSRSRGRSSKSRSRSTSRGRASKKDSTPKRSRSRSSGRKSSKSSTEVTVTKTESWAGQQKKKLQSGAEAAEQKSSSKQETIVEKASTTKEGKVVEQKTEVVKTTMETMKSAPSVKSESSGMTTRSRLAVRQVQNDQKPAPKAEESKREEKGTWLWWFADHAVLVLFIIVSLIALSFTIESISGVRDKLVPDLGTLRQRLGESYNHFTQAVSATCSYVVDNMMRGFAIIKGAIFFTEDAPAQPQATPTPKSSP